MGRSGHFTFLLEVSNLPSKANLKFLNDELKIHQVKVRDILRKTCSVIIVH